MSQARIEERFEARLSQGPMVGDGAMATLLHQYGAPARTCFEALCLHEPKWVQDVHEAYIKAGAEWIQTNTFGASRLGLARHGLEDEVNAINTAAVRLARDAANTLQSSVYVFGTVGSVVDLQPVEPEDDPLPLEAVFEEQIRVLLDAGVDGVVLETFADVTELQLALKVARRLTDLPVMAHLSPDAIGVTRDGMPLTEAFEVLLADGATVVGLNCRLGLTGILKCYEQMELRPDAFYSAVPNSGLLEYVDGSFQYKGTPAYFAEVLRQLTLRGVRFVGGCCGSTPEHIQTLADAVKNVDLDRFSFQPNPTVHVDVAVKSEKRESTTVTISTPVSVGVNLADMARNRTTIVVELDPPRTLDTSRFFRGAKALRDAGVDAVTLADNSLGTVRVSNMALAGMLKQEGIEPLVHVTCRDRNLIGQQSHLMGLHVLGIHHILLVTGDPSRFGDLPGATSVYDVSSIELTKMVRRLNEGTAFSGQPMKHSSQFIVGTSFNPHVRNFDKALERLQRKLDAGADYVMTQPIFDVHLMDRLARAVEPFDVPVFVGIMPLTSARNAMFLHNEVPGIDIPEDVLRKMVNAVESDASSVGIDIAKALLDEAMAHFRGIYLVTPFLRYELTVALTSYVREQEALRV